MSDIIDDSPRRKKIAEVEPKQFSHHLELYRKNEIDDEVCYWLQMAYEQAA